MLIVVTYEKPKTNNVFRLQKKALLIVFYISYEFHLCIIYLFEEIKIWLM